MTTKHTPGPWTHNPRARDGHVDLIAKENSVFVHVGSPQVERPILDYPHDNEQTANARLIAAAPDLLEALRALLLETAAADKQYGENFGESLYCDETLKRARAAIARAEGGAV